MFKLSGYTHTAAISILSLILLIAASFRPAFPLSHGIHNYLLVVDISQSMNVPDMERKGQKITRLAHTQALLRQFVNALPCDTHVGVALFAGSNVATLYWPVEVCANYASIQGTIDHLDWRFGWSGNSRIREGLVSAASILRTLPESARVIFLTDGEEAPKLHAFNTRDLKTFQSGSQFLLVGIGNQKGTPIPKLDEKNQLIGYWSADSFAMQPGVAQISEANIGVRNEQIATSADNQYLSRLDETYLKSVAQEIHAKYIRGESFVQVLHAAQQMPASYRKVSPVPIDWILAGIAGVLILLPYVFLWFSGERGVGRMPDPKQPQAKLTKLIRRQTVR